MEETDDYMRLQLVHVKLTLIVMLCWCKQKGQCCVGANRKVNALKQPNRVHPHW